MHPSETRSHNTDETVKVPEFRQGTATFTLNENHIKFALRSEHNSAALRRAVEDKYQMLKTLLSLEPGSVFWDVGSGFGFSSIVASICSHAKVFQFEPDNDYANLLNENVSLNSLQQRIDILPLPKMSKKSPLQIPIDDTPREFQEHISNSKSSHGAKNDEPCDTDEIDVSHLEAVIKSGKAPPPRYLRVARNLTLPGLFNSNSLILSHRILEEVVLDGIPLPMPTDELRKTFQAHGFTTALLETERSAIDLLYARFSRTSCKADGKNPHFIYDSQANNLATHLKQSYSRAETIKNYPSVARVVDVFPSHVLCAIQCELNAGNLESKNKVPSNEKPKTHFENSQKTPRTRWLSALTSSLISNIIISNNRTRIQEILQLHTLGKDLIVKYASHIQVIRSEEQISLFLHATKDTFLAFLVCIDSPSSLPRNHTATGAPHQCNVSPNQRNTTQLSTNIAYSLAFPSSQLSFIGELEKTFSQSHTVLALRYDLCHGKALVTI